MFANEKHMGHILLESLKERPDSICMIDAGTGEEETNGSVFRRSVQIARCFRRLGLLPGDVLTLSGRNHLDQQIPYFAALMNGLPVNGADPMLKLEEIKSIFEITKSKIAFCEPESYDDYVTASRELGLSTKVFTYGKDEHSMAKLAETYRDDSPVEEFEVATFVAENTYAWLVCSGGTTGVLKLAAITHAALKQKMSNMLTAMFKASDSKDEPAIEEKHYIPGLNLSSIQWISGLFQSIGMPMMQQTKIQTSATVTPEHVIDIINMYKPVTAMLGPPLVVNLLKSDKPCDYSCFHNIIITGAKVHEDVFLALKNRLSKNTLLMEAYGQTETLGPVLAPNPFGPVGNCGRPVPDQLLKLIDPDTGKEITEPNVVGELWTKGVRFSCYYNNPEETIGAFSEDGWFKTGDLLYRDENNNYFFVERLKMLIKYRNYQIIPVELESVIRSHAGVLDVSVTSMPHAEDGEYPVACVVRQPGADVTENEIKDLVASKLSDVKQLRGGVIFLDNLPLTRVGKVARGALRKFVINMKSKEINNYY